MVGSIAQYAGNLHTNLFAPQKEQANSGVSLVASEKVSPAAQALFPSRNMLERNFASAVHDESRYTKAALAGIKASHQIEAEQQNTINAILETARLECANAGSLGETYKAIKRAEKSLNWHQGDEVRKTAEENHFKKTKKHLKEKAQEAQQPAEKSNEKTGTEHAATQQRIAAPVPEENVSASAPDTVEPEATVSATSETVAPAPEVSRPKTAIAKPSIHIIV